MASIFGSQGYRPDKTQMRQTENSLTNAYGGNGQFENQLYMNGKPITADQANTYRMYGAGDKITSAPSEYSQSIPEFNYKPGESGYGFTGQATRSANNIREAYNPTSYQQGEAYTPASYNPTSYQQGPAYSQYQYKTPDLQNQADKYYGGVESQAIESAKAGNRAGMQQAASTLGRRGIAQSGLADQAMGNMSGQLSRDLSGISRDIGMQRANALTDVAKTQGGWDLQRQGMQAGEGQFGANLGQQDRQFGANLGQQDRQFGANLGEQSRQFGSSLGQNDRQFGANMNQRQAEYGSGLEQAIANLMQGSLGSQFDADNSMRQQKMGFARLPYEDMLKQYGIKINSASQNQPGMFGNVMNTLGNAAGGLGTAVSAFK